MKCIISMIIKIIGIMEVRIIGIIIMELIDIMDTMEIMDIIIEIMGIMDTTIQIMDIIIVEIMGITLTEIIIKGIIIKGIIIKGMIIMIIGIDTITTQINILEISPAIIIDIGINTSSKILNKANTATIDKIEWITEINRRLISIINRCIIFIGVPKYS